MLRFLADECCEGQIVRALRAKGHEVSYVSEWGSSLPDASVRQTSISESRILITQDLGIWPSSPETQTGLLGLVLTRLDRLSPDARAQRVAHAVDALGDKLLGHVTVISEGNFRTRPLYSPTRLKR